MIYIYIYLVIYIYIYTYKLSFLLAIPSFLQVDIFSFAAFLSSSVVPIHVKAKTIYQLL